MARVAGVRMEIRVIGPVRIHRDGAEHVLPNSQVRRLLTFMAAWPGESIETERIMVGLWGDHITEKTRNTLQTHVSQLRKLIGGDRVVCEGGGYRLDIEPSNVDAHAVFGLVHSAGLLARAGRFAAAFRAYSDTLMLFRGQAFAGIDDAELRARREELEELFAICQEEKLACAIELSIDRHQLGEHIATARTLVRQRPERERRWELLIRALAAADRLGEATAAFTEVTTSLRESSGLDPGSALQQVIECALRRDTALHPALWSRPDNVPPGESPVELRLTLSPAITLIRNQLRATQRALLWLQVRAEDEWPMAVALGRELRGDFHAGIHLGHLAEMYPVSQGKAGGEYLVIQLSPMPHPKYIEDRLGEAFTAPSLVLVSSESLTFSVPIPTMTLSGAERLETTGY